MLCRVEIMLSSFNTKEVFEVFHYQTVWRSIVFQDHIFFFYILQELLSNMRYFPMISQNVLKNPQTFEQNIQIQRVT